MIKEANYINIREILNRLLRHPLLQDVTLEQVIQYTIDFIGVFGMPKMYSDSEAVVEIKDYRGYLPCDLISIIQAKDNQSGIPLRSITDSFNKDSYSSQSCHSNCTELSFKTQGQVIITSFKDGEITIAYKSIAVDDEGYPLLIDNSKYLRALENFIKKEVFTILFDMGKISPAVLNNTQQQYAWSAGQLESEFSIPSISEMESLCRMWTTPIQKVTEFDNGFRNLGNRQYIKNQ